jgi:hypothetical protein
VKEASRQQQAETPAQRAPKDHWVERWRKRVPEGTRGRQLYDTVFLPLDPPTRFSEAHEQLVERLTPRTADGAVDEGRTKEVLEEAEDIYAATETRVEGAERRATTLQGAVAIASSLLVAGGALLADPDKIRGDGWRVAFALGLVGAVACLVISGARALGATSRIHTFHRPTPINILDRTGTPVAQARIELAAETLKDYGFNAKVADWKVAYLGAAAWWFRWALVLLLALALLIGLYGVFGPDPAPDAAPSGGQQQAPDTP